MKLLDFLYLQPIVSIGMVKDHIGCSYVTAANLVQQFERNKLLIEKTGQKRNKLYSYDTYRVLFSRQALAIQTEERPKK